VVVGASGQVSTSTPRGSGRGSLSLRLRRGWGPAELFDQFDTCRARQRSGGGTSSPPHPPYTLTRGGPIAPRRSRGALRALLGPVSNLHPSGKRPRVALLATLRGGGDPRHLLTVRYLRGSAAVPVGSPRAVPIPAGRASFFKSFSNFADWASVPVRHTPSAPLKIRVADRVADDGDYIDHPDLSFQRLAVGFGRSFRFCISHPPA